MPIISTHKMPPSLKNKKLKGKLRIRWRKKIANKLEFFKMKGKNVRVRTYQWSEFELLTNKMTRWQRSQWARKGYPGLQRKEVALVKPFLELIKS